MLVRGPQCVWSRVCLVGGLAFFRVGAAGGLGVLPPLLGWLLVKRVVCILVSLAKVDGGWFCFQVQDVLPVFPPGGVGGFEKYGAYALDRGSACEWVRDGCDKQCSGDCVEYAEEGSDGLCILFAVVRV